MKYTLSLRHIHHWFGGAIEPALEVAERADAAGIAQLSVVDHILMGEDLSSYPYGKIQFEPAAHWWEPTALLGAIAGRTTRIRLATAVIVSPLRPAVLLAKQLTTLDWLSRGRIDAGLGAGWQKAEYEACGVAWSHRFAQLEEQISACRALWTSAPAAFAGTYVAFDGIHQQPFPVQAGGIPIWLGLGDSDRNLERVAALADGWCPPSNDVARLTDSLGKLRELMQSRGRDPDRLRCRVVLPIETGRNGGPDLDASLARVADYEKLGIDLMEITPAVFGRHIGDLDGILTALNSAR